MKSKEEIEKRLLGECVFWINAPSVRLDYDTQPIIGWIEALAWVLDQEKEINEWLKNVDD